MVGFLFTRRHPFGMAKNSRLGAKGACNQGKEAFRAESMQSGATPPPRLLLERMLSSGSSTIELCLMAKCALWGLRGRTPYKA